MSVSLTLNFVLILWTYFTMICYVFLFVLDLPSFTVLFWFSDTVFALVLSILFCVIVFCVSLSAHVVLYLPCEPVLCIVSVSTCVLLLPQPIP